MKAASHQLIKISHELTEKEPRIRRTKCLKTFDCLWLEHFASSIRPICAHACLVHRCVRSPWSGNIRFCRVSTYWIALWSTLAMKTHLGDHHLWPWRHGHSQYYQGSDDCSVLTHTHTHLHTHIHTHDHTHTRSPVTRTERTITPSTNNSHNRQATCS
jgi:hypothetical protein